MADNDTPEKFPENEVDNLIADFGKKPEGAERDKLRDMLRAQEDKFNAVESALEFGNEQEQGMDHEQDRGR